MLRYSPSLLFFATCAAITCIAPDMAFAAKEAKEAGLPQLKFETFPSQIFWLFLTFGILYLLLAKKNIPEISSTVEGRREKIEDDLDNAHSLKEEAESVQTAYEESLVGAREKASDTLKKTEEAIKSKRDESLNAFKERSEKLTGETEKRVEAATSKILEETQDIAAEIAQVAAEKIVGVSTDIKQAKAHVKTIVKTIDNSNKKKAA